MGRIVLVSAGVSAGHDGVALGRHDMPTLIRACDLVVQIAGVATDVPETAITAVAPGPAAELAYPAAAR